MQALLSFLALPHVRRKIQTRLSFPSPAQVDRGSYSLQVVWIREDVSADLNRTERIRPCQTEMASQPPVQPDLVNFAVVGKLNFDARLSSIISRVTVAWVSNVRFGRSM